MPLDPTNSAHSIPNALALAKACKLVYSDEAEIKAGLAAAIGLPLREFKFFTVPATDTQAFLAGFEGAMVLCFRGSGSRQDWLQNSQILPVPFHQGGTIHIGFRNAIDSITPFINDTLTEWAGQGRTFWITGHSLGGALAMLSAAYLRFPADPTRMVPRPFAGLYTFGQPRVGNKLFCDACSTDFGARYFRYINNSDIVTRIPPREVGYWHTGFDQYIDPYDKIHQDPVWWQMFIDRVRVGIEQLRLLQTGVVRISQVADHSMDEYIRRIQANVS
jgi:triacylglycerol lipase